MRNSRGSGGLDPQLFEKFWGLGSLLNSRSKIKYYYYSYYYYQLDLRWSSIFILSKMIYNSIHYFQFEFYSMFIIWNSERNKCWLLSTYNYNGLLNGIGLTGQMGYPIWPIIKVSHLTNFELWNFFGTVKWEMPLPQIGWGIDSLYWAVLIVLLEIIYGEKNLFINCFK